MTNCADIQPRLSEFADGHLEAGERAEIDAHLAKCVACRGLYQDLQRVRRAAASLEPITPPDHVWMQVAGQARLDRPAPSPPKGTPARRAAFAQWAGLAAALVLITLGAQFFMRTAPVPSAPGNPAGAPAVERIAEELSQGMQHIDNAIAELEALTQADSDALGTQLAEDLRKTRQVVDAAVDESRQAFEQNPGSELAQRSLFEALRRKVVVLQATVNLMNQMRKGNQTGAVEAAAALGKKS
jgi:hypothetical protein